MSVRVLCPKCSTKCVIGEDKIGKGFTCPCCGNRMRVPKSEDMEAVDFLRNRLPELPTLPSATNGSGHTVTAFEIKQNRIETLFPPSAPRKRQTVPWQKIALATPIFLGVFIAVGVYFRSVPEDWEAVKKAVTPEEKPAKQLTKANAPGLKEEKVAEAKPLGKKSNFGGDVMEVSIFDLCSTYENELAGEAKYGGKKVMITGKYFAFWGDSCLYERGRAVYCLTANGGLKVELPKKYTWAQLSDVMSEKDTEGLKVSVVGVCKGFMGKHLVVGNCRVLTTEDELAAQLQARFDAKAKEELRLALELENEARESDPYTFSATRKTKFLQVTGKVERILDASYKSEIRVFLIPNGWKSSMSCFFRNVPEIKSKLTTLKPGEVITVRGLAKYGLPGDFNLKNCIFIE